MKFKARKFLEGCAILVIIILPPFFITNALIFPITSNESFLQSATATSTLVAERASIPQNFIANQFQAQTNKFEQIGVANFSALARYNTKIVNNMSLTILDASGTVLWFGTSTLTCASQTIPYGSPIAIASDANISDTENILGTFACTSVSFPTEVYGRGYINTPNSKIVLTANAPLTSDPTLKSYLWIFFVVSGIWVGFIIATKEMIHFIRNGFKYLWS
jgi:hypothetical protein